MNLLKTILISILILTVQQTLSQTISLNKSFPKVIYKEAKGYFVTQDEMTSIANNLNRCDTFRLMYEACEGSLMLWIEKYQSMERERDTIMYRLNMCDTLVTTLKDYGDNYYALYQLEKKRNKNLKTTAYVLTGIIAIKLLYWIFK